MKTGKSVLTLLIVLILNLSFFGCRTTRPIEKTGDAVGSAVESTGEAVGDAIQWTGETVEDATH